VPKSSTSKGEQIPKRTADRAEVAFRRLQQAILTGELAEGDRVREARLATDWGIGITPLREAVRRMAAMGYVVLKPNHAPTVRKIDANDIRQIYEIREALECLALKNVWDMLHSTDLSFLHRAIARVDASKTKPARLQAQFALDAQFHGLWSTPADNPWMAGTLERVFIYRPNLMSVMARHAHLVEEAYEQHQEILQAIEARQQKKALLLLAQHVHRSGDILAEISSS